MPADDSSSEDDDDSDIDASATAKRNAASSSDDDTDDGDHDSEEEEEEDSIDDDGDGMGESSAPSIYDDDGAELSLGQRLQRRQQQNDDAAQTTATRLSRQRKGDAKRKALERIKAMQKEEAVAGADEKAKKQQSATLSSKSKSSKKKTSKHRPTEASSKRADFYANHVTSQNLNERGIGVTLGAHRYKPADPRGSNLAGHYDADQFNRNYAFVQDLRASEIAALQKRIKLRQAKGGRARAARKKILGDLPSTTLQQDQDRLGELQTLQATVQRQQIDTAAQRAVKQHVREASVRAGQAVHLKRREHKQLLYEARLAEIATRQGRQAASKVAAKRRKRVKTKHSKRLS